MICTVIILATMNHGIAYKNTSDRNPATHLYNNKKTTTTTTTKNKTQNKRKKKEKKAPTTR